MTLHGHQYRLPFEKPFETSQQSFAHRRGLILEYKTSNDSFYGDAAPLPGFSKASLDEVIARFRRLKPEIAEILKAPKLLHLLKDLHRKHDIPPALAFGIDTLIYQVAAQRENRSLGDFLFSNATSAISVNALAALSSDNLIPNIRKVLNDGYQTIKFKIGINFEQEFRQLQKLRNEFPDLAIRLDANQAWNLNVALQNCKKLAGLNIEYCEEPLADATPQNFQQLQQNTSLTLALDESITNNSFWTKLLPFSSHVILKPMLLGSFTKLFETKRLADTHDNGCVFTTSLESAIGRRATAVLASGLGSAGTAHGLDTAQLLAKDIVSETNLIRNGKYRLRNMNESSINPEKLQKLSM